LMINGHINLLSSKENWWNWAWQETEVKALELLELIAHYYAMAINQFLHNADSDDALRINGENLHKYLSQHNHTEYCTKSGYSWFWNQVTKVQMWWEMQ
jgi:hypothetical protein